MGMLQWLSPVKPESHQIAAGGPQCTLPSNPLAAAGPGGIALLTQMSTPWVRVMWPLVQ